MLETKLLPRTRRNAASSEFRTAHHCTKQSRSFLQKNNNGDRFHHSTSEATAATTHNKTSWRYKYYGTFQRKNQQLSQSGESCLNTATSVKAACSERQTRQSKRAAPDSGTTCERIVCSLARILSEFAEKSPDRWDIPYYNRATIKGKELNKRTMQEASRIILGLRAAGWDEKSINDFILWIETGNNEYKPKKDLPA